MAICGMKSIDLTTDFTNIVGICFSYNQKIKEEPNLSHTISSIQRVNGKWGTWHFKGES